MPGIARGGEAPPAELLCLRCATFGAASLTGTHCEIVLWLAANDRSDTASEICNQSDVTMLLCSRAEHLPEASVELITVLEGPPRGSWRDP